MAQKETLSLSLIIINSQVLFTMILHLFSDYVNKRLILLINKICF